MTAATIAADPVPATFVSVPRTIQAIQFTEMNWKRINRWLTDELGTGKFYFLTSGDEISLHIETAEGPRDCPPGYWIVKGTHGEFYPVPHEVFVHKYELVAA